MRAEAIAKALGGRRAGAVWMARCPAHDDREPSLSIRDAQNIVLVRCHAGCEQEQVIGELRARGLWSDRHRPRFARIASASVLPSARDNDQTKRSADALAIWRVAKPAASTLVEAYLGSRGLRISPPSTLRFHPGLKHPSGGIWPAMIALVTRGPDDVPVAIHRTFLARDGRSKAPIDPQKMMLGPCRGGTVRLATADDLLMVGEGIETCLAAMLASRFAAWAALSTSGLRSLNPPQSIREIIVLADGDDPGEAAARDCALRWKREGRCVRIARPPRGRDFNDVLIGCASEEVVQ